MRRDVAFAAALSAVALTALPIRPVAWAEPTADAEPVITWSHEAQHAIVPPGPGGVFGTENYGNKFPGDAAVYMGIVHAAMYDAAVALRGGFRPYAIDLSAPDASPAAAISTAAHHVLIGMQPQLGISSARQSALNARYADYLAGIPDGTAKAQGVDVGERVAAAVLELRHNDGREANPQIGQPPFVPPPAGPGVWDPGTAPALGLRLPGMRPLALQAAAQFRPDGPNPLISQEYADDLSQVSELGRADSTARTSEQTATALFWTDHDVRQWNEGLLRLAQARGLDLMQTARMLAMTHVSGGDALIGCFDAKYTYWFWRPFQAIPRADSDGNPATTADPSWRPLRATPNHPEYPSGHACHSTAIAEALQTFFGTDKVTFTLDSRVTGATRVYDRFHDVVKDVNRARVLAGFHFRNSDQEGSTLGRKVAGYVTDHFFQPT